MASAAKQSKKLRILVMPFFATSHILPLTDLAFHLAAVRPDDVEVVVAVTPANAPIVQSALARREPSRASVEVATYAFPAVDGLPPGVENMSTVTAADSWRLELAATDEALLRPAQESLIRESSPDAIVSDLHFFRWNAGIAAELGIPCVLFNVVGIFSTLATWRLALCANVKDAPAGSSVTVPQFPGPEISLPVTELSEFLRNPPAFDKAAGAHFMMLLKSCGFISNTVFDLEREYCESYADSGYVKRTYCVGPVALPMAPPARAGSAGRSACLDWLDTKPTHSVVYLCFGSLTNLPEAQLDELALGLEASGVPFLWVVRVKKWEPPVGWKDRVGDRGMVVMGWAPQTDILQHPAVGAFVTQCGWNSVQETIAAGVPVLTWPMVYEQFISERFMTHVLRIGERLWPEGAGRRSTRYAEHDVIPAKEIAQSVAKFMENGGAAEAARRRAMELSPKVHAAIAEGGTSNRDLHQLIDDFIEARASVAGTTTS
ncbi:UDP-glycosyltransferase 73E1-like [Panicum miliaceum]|uniref:Glycosyltransferase n=1 Tax=Panicum miliaceum TaxID=4540 RepID=A0A3L6Q2V8_PANMI|nr:UDP-glycosyltransferase 73E1-like [Panicum miliaceum]